MSTNIPHYEENTRRIRGQPQTDPDEALDRMRSSQVEMRASIDAGAWQNTRWHESFTDLQNTLQKGRAQIFLQMHTWIDQIYRGGKAAMEKLLAANGYTIKKVDRLPPQTYSELRGGRIPLTPSMSARSVPSSESLVSIIIPALDGGPFIERTLMSILRQDYPSLEVIVVDAGSSDHTNEIVRRYPEVRLIQGHGKGYAESLNSGLKVTKGSVIGIQHCDDYYAPGAVAEAVEIFSRYPDAALVAGKRVVVAPNGAEAGRSESAASRWIDLWDLIEGTATPFHEASFVRRNLIDEVGGFNTEVDHSAILDLWLRILSRWPGLWVDRFWGFRQVQPKSRRHSACEQIAVDVGRSFELWMDSLHPESRAEFRDRIRGCAYFRQTHFYNLAGSRSKARELLERAIESYPALLGNATCRRLARDLEVSATKSDSERDQLVTQTRPVDTIDHGFEAAKDPQLTWYARP